MDTITFVNRMEVEIRAMRKTRTRTSKRSPVQYTQEPRGRHERSLHAGTNPHRKGVGALFTYVRLLTGIML